MKCHTVLIEKVVVDLHSGIRQDLTIITLAMEQRAHMDNGVLVVLMDIIHKMDMHIIMATVVLVA